MSELEIKEQMAERLTKLLLLDPVSTTVAIKSLFSFNYEVANHEVLTNVLSRDLLITDMIGIINGLVGAGEYRIAPVVGKQGNIACFEVVPVDPAKIATVKQLEELRFNEVSDGTQALEDK